MTISVFFLGFSACLSFLFSIGEFSSAKKFYRNWYLGFIFLFLGIFIFQSFLWSSGLIKLYPHMLHIHIPATALVGVFFERYLLLTWESQVESFRRFLFKCGVCVSIVLFTIPLYLKSSEEKLKYIEDCYKEGTPLHSKIAILIVISVMFYFFLSILFRFKNLFRKSTLLESKTLQLVLVILVLGFVGIMIGGYFAIYGSYIGIETNGYIFGIFLIVLYILRIRYPEIFQEVRIIVEEEKKYKNSQLKSVNLKDVGQKLTNLLEVDKIYREDNINLSELASRIGISNHQLSEYLNKELKLPFFSLIHKYRIEEAKTFLVTNPDETVLSIAYKVGYQSKSSFNEIFKKETGFTPTEFRKKTKK